MKKILNLAKFSTFKYFLSYREKLVWFLFANKKVFFFEICNLLVTSNTFMGYRLNLFKNFFYHIEKNFYGF